MKIGKLSRALLYSFYSGVIAICLISCGSGAASGLAAGTLISETVAVAILNTAPLASCPFGGITVQSGIDTNVDRVLQLSEATSTQYLCNGNNGTNGVNGVNGVNGINGINGLGGAIGITAQVAVTKEPVGINCPQGGSSVRVGLDLNRNSILDLSEVTTVDYICNGTVGVKGSSGTNGTNGSNGANGTIALNSLVAIVFEPAGKNCTFGGSEVSSGLDKNGDNVLDKDEITTTGYVCNGSSQTNPAYAYIYNLKEQTVAIDAAVQFDSNGLFLGIEHEAGAAEIRILDAGIYTISFSVSGAEPSQFGLFANGLVVPGSVYGSGAGTQQNSGQITLALAVDDRITLVNYSSAAAVTLPSVMGGKQANVNASIRIQKIYD